jgi:hypothetical protein
MCETCEAEYELLYGDDEPIPYVLTEPPVRWVALEDIPPIERKYT